MTFYQELRGVDVDAISQVEEIVALLAIAKAIRAEFEAHTSLIETPEWLDDKIKSLGRELKARTADVLEKRYRETLAKRESLRTPEEKRKAVDAEIEALQKKRQEIGA